MSTTPLDLTLGVTGASGARFAGAVLRDLAAHPDVGTIRLVISEHAWDNLRAELGRPQAAREELEEHLLAVPEGRGKIVRHGKTEMAAPISSGSHRSHGMIVLPCSMASLGAIAQGAGTSLVHRAADVALKQRRPLLLCVRESPYSVIHLENMVRAARAGATIVPITVMLYSRPASVEEVIDQFAARVLDLLGLEGGRLKRWDGLR
ncbi:MAG: UbiX family flavin prenyltransferase [Acidobacteriota bacterium]|jgi:4-hydroxy-3-polyprenylbenzoate decarboxylase